MRINRVFFACCLLLAPLAAWGDDYVHIENKYIRVNVHKETGRFVVKTVRGNLDNKEDDNKYMLYNDTPPTSFTTIALDKGDDVYKYGSSDGKFITAPKVENGSIVSVWEVDECRVTQTISFVNSPVSSVLNSIKITYKIENKDDEKKVVGVRVMYDTPFDGEPYFIPGYGKVDDEKEFKDDKIPQYWYSFDNLKNPKLRTMGSLFGKGITMPKRVIFASWKKLAEKSWKYEADDGATFKRSWFGSRDSAVAVYYHSRTLSPGDSRTITSVYGLYDIKQFTGKAWSILMGGSKHGDNVTPFAVTADVKNISKHDMTNCYVILTVPDGFKVLDNVRGSNRKTHIRFKEIEKGEQKRLSWNLLANRTFGQHKYAVSVSGFIGKKLYTARMERTIFITQVHKVTNVVKKRVENRTNTPFYFTGRTTVYRSEKSRIVVPTISTNKRVPVRRNVIRVVEKKGVVVKKSIVVKKVINKPIRRINITKPVEKKKVQSVVDFSKIDSIIANLKSTRDMLFKKQAELNRRLSLLQKKSAKAQYDERSYQVDMARMRMLLSQIIRLEKAILSREKKGKP